METSYCPNVVAHTSSGKAVSRSLHGHVLVEVSLINKLIDTVLPHVENEGHIQGNTVDILMMMMMK